MKTLNKVEAQAQGHNGIITFEVDLSDNQIEDLKVMDHSETPGIFNQVFDKLKTNILKQQSFAVDTISGATVMTKAILDSGQKAVRAEGITLGNTIEKEVPHKTIDVTADVAVIGGGEAGLVAACRALSLGKEVVLVEKNGYLGGATILNGSNVVGTGSKVSQTIFGEKATLDSSKRLFTDVTRESAQTNYPELSYLMAENIGAAIDFISKFADLKYQAAQTQTPEHSVERQIELPSASSYEFIKKVAQAFQDKGGRILLDTRVEDLLKSKQGQLSGFIAEGPYTTTRVHATSVILASGGYGANEKMRSQGSQQIDYYGPMTSTGDSYQFMQSMNLKTHDLDWYKVYPHGLEVEPGIAKLTTYASKKATDMGAIYVNRDGQRIVNESDVYVKFRDAILKQPDQIAFLVMDARTWHEFYNLLVLHDFTAKEINGYFANQGTRSPILAKGSLSKVAKLAGINSSGLKKTIKSYSGYIQAQKDSEFGRDPQYLHDFVGDTYYIIEQRDRFATTLGGYTARPNDMALEDNNEQPVAHLYGAGEVVGGANGHDSMPSMMNTWAIASGYVAGKSASQVK
ncbi:FAD-dependent oxidoreductase [Loigolactobacillus coryniformis]|uniref:FAD-dependent oxidoreductase n=1 Tax=Loigolactobacillus coryniformis TaxID=1610 RepID=UPI00201AE98C|nr:FAD-dependent oxidoreductase [Loigolactobacillus coryniformis]